MTGTRGPRSRVLPIHPNWVLTKAMKTGLSTAVYLQKTIKTKATRHLYSSSQDILHRASEAYYISKADGRPEFKHIMVAEHNIRKNGLDMLEEIAAAYGNTETVRVKNRLDTVGPLNQRFNIGGRSLREFVMCRYPLPVPDKLLDSAGNELGIGYPAHSRAPYYFPIHKTLPEMDFIDSTRMHTQILDTHCSIYDVSNRDTSRYNNLLLLRMRPYLDYIYSEHNVGDGEFRDGTIKELRIIKDDISNHFQIHVGTKQTVTSSTSFKQPVFRMKFFKDQISEAKKAGVSQLYLNELKRIRTKGSIISVKDDGTTAPCLTENDVAYLWKEISRKSRKLGSLAHHKLSRFFDGFWNIRRAIVSETPFREGEVYRLVSEMPLKTHLGKGRADLVLLKREAAPKGLKTVHRPVMVVEIKTKSAFHWAFIHKKKNSASRDMRGMDSRFVPEFLTWTRTLDDSEWNAVLESTPDPDTPQQLDAYAQALSNEFSNVTGIEQTIPILRAILVIDPSEINSVTEDVIRDLVITAFEKNADITGSIPRTLFEIRKTHYSRVGLVVYEQKPVSDYSGIAIASPSQPVYNPLYSSSFNKRNFILYLSSASPTSAGSSAGWIARYYHGLQYISQLEKAKPDSDVVWIDLVNDFVPTQLAEARLRVFTHDEQVQQPSDVQETFARIRFEGIFSEVHRFLYEGEGIPSITKLDKYNGDNPLIVIVSGWDTINESTPSSYRNRLDRLLAGILHQIPQNDDVIVLWFDTPIPDEYRSAVYNSRCLLPFRNTSPLFGEVTKIIWNLPVAPANEIQSAKWNLPTIPDAPLYDDIRVLLTHDIENVRIELIHIPPLMGWSAKFRTEQYVRTVDEFPLIINQQVPNADERNQLKALALTLIPWIGQLWPNHTIDLFDETRTLPEALNYLMKKRDSVDTERVTFRMMDGSVSSEPTLLERMKFRPDGSKGLKSYIGLSVEKINSQRLYRQHARLKTKVRSSFLQLTDVRPILEHQHLFGQVITSSDTDKSETLVIVENQPGLSTLAIGLFTSACKTDTDGFQWAHADVRNSASEIRELLSSGKRTNLIMIKNEDYFLAWEDPSRKSTREYHGTLELRVGARIGSIAVLRAVKRSVESFNQTNPDVPFPTNFSDRVSQSVERLLHILEESEPVIIHLSWDPVGCLAEFKNSDDETIHELRYSGTADLVNTLSMIRKGLPLIINSSESVYWNSYNDIDYGDLSIAATVTESYVPQDASVHLPARLDVLQSLPEESPIEVTIIHDEQICPLFQKSGTNHGRCWKMQVVTGNAFIKAHFNGAHSDREILLKLGSEKFVIGNRLYPLVIHTKGTLQDKEGLVYRESRLIIKTLQKHGAKYARLVPGTYLQSQAQKWVVSISSSDDWLTWTASSTLTGKYWKEKSFTFELDFSYKLSEVEDELLAAITMEIPITEIENPNDLRDLIKDKLVLRGFSDDTQDVHLEITRSGRMFTETLRKLDRSKTVLNVRTFSINPQDSIEGIMEGIYYHLSEGELSIFNVVNESEYIEEFGTLLKEIDTTNPNGY